jgi:hypothetical protein
MTMTGSTRPEIETVRSALAASVVDAVRSTLAASLSDGAERHKALNEAVVVALATSRDLLTVVDRLEREVSDLRRELLSTRKIAKRAMKKGRKG